MKVKSLINYLKEMNPEAEVRLHYILGEPLLFVVNAIEDSSVVWLEAESDNDMGSEISSRFENAENGIITELELYKDMLELGINVSMVKKYMGTEYADKMQSFCKKHNLINK